MIGENSDKVDLITFEINKHRLFLFVYFNEERNLINDGGFFQKWKILNAFLMCPPHSSAQANS